MNVSQPNGPWDGQIWVEVDSGGGGNLSDGEEVGMNIRLSKDYFGSSVVVDAAVASSYHTEEAQ